MRIVNDFIASDFIESIRKENQELLYSSVWKTNLGWQEEIISPIGSVLIRDLSTEQKETLLNALCEKNIVNIDQIEELEAQSYLWQPLSFIPWHSDKDEDDRIRYAATLYLNDQWEDDWGGLFLFKDKTGIHAESPTYKKLVFNDNNYPHATTIISSVAPLRETIQLFWKLK